MGVVTVGSIGLIDAAGDAKSLALYFDGGNTFGDVMIYMQEIATLLDACIDAKINSISVTLGITAPGGLKTTPAAGNSVHVGALLGFDVANSNFSQSFFIPSWKNAGFAGKSVLNTGPYAALITALVTHTTSVTIGVTSEEAEDVIAFLKGSYRVRK
jgi:hypothetical protein